MCVIVNAKAQYKINATKMKRRNATMHTSSPLPVRRERVRVRVRTKNVKDQVSASISAGVTGGAGVGATGLGGTRTFAATSFLSSIGLVVTATFFSTGCLALTAPVIGAVTTFACAFASISGIFTTA